MGSLGRDVLINELVELSHTLDELQRKLDVARAIHDRVVSAERDRRADMSPSEGASHEPPGDPRR